MSDKHSFTRSRLMERYPADTEGEWDIHGEDPNCDMGGYHHEPFLQRVTGRYADVVEYALNLPDFYSWGGGGSIKLAIKASKAIPRGYKHDEKARQEAKNRIKELEAQIAKLKAEHNL